MTGACSEKLCWLLRDAEPGSGGWNMAVDEWLLEQAQRGQAALRFYAWNEPTLSLGYFQVREGLEIPASLAMLPRVRRLTGGGAILHDRELTYSLAIPAEHAWAHAPVEIYTRLHRALLGALSQQQVQGALRGEEQPERNGAFLCFTRGDRNDVLIGTHKILGSAQRRRKGAILQHGSLILHASPLAPEIPGIADLTGIAVDPQAIAAAVIADLGDELGPWEACSPDETESREQIQSLISRYTADSPSNSAG